VNTVEVVFSPALYPYKQTQENFIAVVIDVLRATTSMTAALAHGVAKIIPVSDLDEAKTYKSRGYLVAAERDGKYLDFADYGNSPFDYLNNDVVGKTIAYSTTNGSQAINLAGDAQQTIIAALINVTAVTNWLIQQNLPVVVLCAGWKGMFNLEDTACAGLICKGLIESGNFSTTDDATKASILLANEAMKDLPGFIEQASHRDRLRLLGADESLDYCLSVNQVNIVAGMKDGVLIKLGDVSV
jgi:2-phosphosulfolactate phosphatase